MTIYAGSFGVLTLEGEEFDMKENYLFDNEVYVNLGMCICFKYSFSGW